MKTTTLLILRIICKWLVPVMGEKGNDQDPIRIPYHVPNSKREKSHMVYVHLKSLSNLLHFSEWCKYNKKMPIQRL